MSSERPDISVVAPWPGQDISALLRPCDKPIVLAGAGVSASCGLPTGAELALWMRRQGFAAGFDFSGLDEEGRGSHVGYVSEQILRDADVADRAEVLGAVAAHIRAAQERATFSRVVEAIAGTPAGVVLTLNYDSLIEDAARAQGRVAHSVELDEVQGLINDSLLGPGEELKVIHLHGSIGEPTSLIIDHTSYMKQAGDNRVSDLLTALVSRNNFCAIGTQFDEDYLSSMMLQRRPSRPRHVIVCDVDLAEKVRRDEAGIKAGRHNWRACSYAVGEYQALEGFCEHLVTCEEPPLPSGPYIATFTVEFETDYAHRRFIVPEDAETLALAPELQLQFGILDAREEAILEQEQLALVIGPPGSGKTRLMQELARREGPERPLFLRLRDVDDVVGQPDLLLRRWLETAVSFTGERTAIDDVVEGRVRAWLLLDGLDEVALERRSATAEAVERLAWAFPQHRFTVTSRPVAALANLTDSWQKLELVCDLEWRREYVQANDIDERWLQSEVGERAALGPLLDTPFFLVAALSLLEAGEEVGDAMQIASALLERSLQGDDRLAALGPAPRRWLGEVALWQQLNGRTTIDEQALRVLSKAEDLGDPELLTDLLASRSLLVESNGSWSFAHRLFGEVLVAERLLSDTPERWLDVVAPEADGWSAVLDQWSAPLQLALACSSEWRQAIATRDPCFAARSTPGAAPADERSVAAQTLWREAVEWQIWLNSVDRASAPGRSKLIAGFIQAGGLEQVEAEIRGALSSASHFDRANALEVLSEVPVADLEPILAAALGDDDSVVRRTAALAAGRLDFSDLADLVAERAISPADRPEAEEMASVAVSLLPDDRKLAFARELLEAGNSEAPEQMTLEQLPLVERVEWLTLRVRSVDRDSPALAHAIQRLAEDACDADPATLEAIGYLVARSGARQPALLDFLAAHAETTPGLRRAQVEGHVTAEEVERSLRPLEATPRTSTTVDTRVGIAATDALGENLAAVMLLPVAERRAKLIERVALDRLGIKELGLAERDLLAATLDEWWGDADLGEAVHRSGRGAEIANWASVVLAFGPAIDLALDDARWVQVATCRWLFPPQLDWLGSQATQARLDRAAASVSDVLPLTDLLRIANGLDAGAVRERLQVADLEGVDNDKLVRAGEALREAEGLPGLLRLAAADERWGDALRPQLAAAGDPEAQLTELAALVERLHAGSGTREIDTTWLQDVRDPRALPVLSEALIGVGARGGTEGPTGTAAPIRRAIASIGGVEAIAVLDQIARERPYPGAQFLVEDRDRLLQSLLLPQAERAAQELA